MTTIDNRARMGGMAYPAPTGPAIRVIDKERIEITLGTESCVLSRRCPHEGADLSLGYVQDGTLFCPWHNLRFDVRTGRHPCQTLPPLKKFES